MRVGAVTQHGYVGAGAAAGSLPRAAPLISLSGGISGLLADVRRSWRCRTAPDPGGRAIPLERVGMYRIAPWSRRRPGDQAAVRPKMPAAFPSASWPGRAGLRPSGWRPRAARWRRIGMLSLPGRQRSVLRGIEASTRSSPFSRARPACRRCLRPSGFRPGHGGGVWCSWPAASSWPAARSRSAGWPPARTSGRGAPFSPARIAGREMAWPRPPCACRFVCRLPGEPKPRDRAAGHAAAVVNHGYGATGHSGTG
jgi:hypothetical protein